jgi:prolipoprotein diacylglyceryl transferase
MFPILQLGPLALQLPGLALLIGVWVGTWLIDRVAPRYKVSATVLNNMVLVGLVAGIVGARLWYALRYLDVYLNNPLSLFSLNPSTLASTEGILTGLLAAMIYGQRNQLSLWPTLDALAPSFAAFSIALGISHSASGDAFGSISDLPWAIELWGDQRHPSQVYEILIAGLIFFIVWRMLARRGFSGFLFLSWVVFAAGSRLFLEAFRGDSVIILGSLRGAQVISFLVLIGAMLTLRYLGRLSQKNVALEA